MDVFKGAQNKAGQMEWQALGALNLITIGKSSLKNPQALRGEARASERQEDSTEPPSSISSPHSKGTATKISVHPSHKVGLKTAHQLLMWQFLENAFYSFRTAAVILKRILKMGRRDYPKKSHFI